MKTFGITLLIMECLGLVFWLYLMLQKQPEGWNSMNRLEANWKGGGHIALLMILVCCFIISIAISKFVLWMNFLEG